MLPPNRNRKQNWKSVKRNVRTKIPQNAAREGKTPSVRQATTARTNDPEIEKRTPIESRCPGSSRKAPSPLQTVNKYFTKHLQLQNAQMIEGGKTECKRIMKKP